jgi:hypothetical protein
MRWAVAGRRFLAPHFRDRPALAYLLTAAILIVIFLWGPIPSTRNPPTMLAFTVLAFIGMYFLRAQILEEFPDAEAVSIRDSLREHTHSLGEKIGRLRSSPSGSGDAGSSKVGELERLAELHQRKALSDAEYEDAKREILAG